METKDTILRVDYLLPCDRRFFYKPIFELQLVVGPIDEERDLFRRCYHHGVHEFYSSFVEELEEDGIAWEKIPMEMYARGKLLSVEEAEKIWMDEYLMPMHEGCMADCIEDHVYSPLVFDVYPWVRPEVTEPVAVPVEEPEEEVVFLYEVKRVRDPEPLRRSVRLKETPQPIYSEDPYEWIDRDTEEEESDGETLGSVDTVSELDPLDYLFEMNWPEENVEVEWDEVAQAYLPNYFVQ